MNILRRLPLSRLLLLCALAVAIGVSLTALASALDAGPTPPPKPLAQAIHDALGGGHVEGVSANIVLSDHLLEGADLATGGDGGAITSNPLVAGASGRLWSAADGDFRLELQSEQGDTQVLYDGHTLSLYDAASNMLYRYTPPPHEGDGGAGAGGEREVPSVARIEEAISQLSKHADVSPATPTDIAGQPAYTVRISPNEGGSLFAGVELSFDANHGVPLRAALYSSDSSTPVIELAATEISYGQVPASVFELNPPANVKVQEISLPQHHSPAAKPANGDGHPKLTTYGHGVSSIAVLESSRDGEGKAKGAGGGESEPLEGLPKVTVDGASASELRTELGTLLTFERSGVRYLLVGSVAPAALEAIARGL
jgi:outer membrane lipoprotein-sorting protein